MSIVVQPMKVGEARDPAVNELLQQAKKRWWNDTAMFGVIARQPELTVLKVDIGKNAPLVAFFAVKSVPTLLLFKDGVCIDRRSGKVPFVEIDRMITKNM